MKVRPMYIITAAKRSNVFAFVGLFVWLLFVRFVCLLSVYKITQKFLWNLFGGLVLYRGQID